MQQQVTSYAYQLSQNLEKSILECHMNEPLFYCAAKVSSKTSKSSSRSHLYRLHFEEQNPRKSQIKNQQIQGTVQGIYSVTKDTEDLLVLLKDNQNNYSLNKTTYPLLEDEVLKLSQIQSYGQQKYQLLAHKQTKKQFLVGKKDIFSVNEETLKKGEKLVEVDTGNGDITYGVIDPIHELLTYVVGARDIIVTDKTMKKYLVFQQIRQKYALKIGSSDLSLIQSIDYNPNKQYYLMSSHLQCIKFWDVRKPNLPVKLYTDHHSLLLHSKYNHSHDELITCAYDDGTVGLLRMSSVSSTPGEGQDTMVKVYDQHQDSVFVCKWANMSPWVFISLSYAASSVVVNYVPSVEKYRILL